MSASASELSPLCDDNTKYEMPRRLSANPHFYDYIHVMMFDGEDVLLMDGGGQFMNFQKAGKYTTTWESEHRGELNIMLPGNTDEINVVFTIEDGTFEFKSNTFTGLKYTADRKYTFDSDPLEVCKSSRNGNLMFMSNDEGDEARRTYYANVAETYQKPNRDVGNTDED